MQGRSPLHPSAMRINDVHPGVSFIRFNIYGGIVSRGRFLTGPMRGDTVTPFGPPVALGTGSMLVAWAIVPDFRRPVALWLTDMGIINWVHGYWDPEVFTVKANKEHLLPAVLARPRPQRFFETRDELPRGYEPIKSFEPSPYTYEEEPPSFKNFQLPIPLDPNPDFGAAHDYLRRQRPAPLEFSFDPQVPFGISKE